MDSNSMFRTNLWLPSKELPFDFQYSDKNVLQNGSAFCGHILCRIKVWIADSSAVWVMSDHGGASIWVVSVSWWLKLHVYGKCFVYFSFVLLKEDIRMEIGHTSCDLIDSGKLSKPLTHWGRVTHICVSKRTIISSDNGLSPSRRQAIIWTNAGILLIGPSGTNFSEILIDIITFSFKKMRLKVSSAKWRPCCLGLNVLMTKRGGEVIAFIDLYRI